MSGLTSSVAYCTDSAGMHPSHTLPMKLAAIAAAGFPQVELAFPDLEAFAEQEYPGYKKLDERGRGDPETLCLAAGNVKELCEWLGLTVLVVHPFARFEGYVDPDKKAIGFERARAWFRVLKALGCDMLQVGASDDPESSRDYDVIAGDLRQLADEAAAQDPPIRLAYEMWAWSVNANTWEQIWEVCKRVDRPNFGLCLDTFHIGAVAYADPTSETRLLRNHPHPSKHLAENLEVLASTLDPSKIFYFQISDGSRNVTPEALVRSAKEQGIPPLYAWSNEWRPLPFMDTLNVPGDYGRAGAQGWGGYLPVAEICDAVLKTGYRGPWSYEVFYKSDMERDDPAVPEKWANAAWASHVKLVEECSHHPPP